MPLSEILKNLCNYAKNNNITEADFLTHSFGSVVLKVFSETKVCKMGQVLELAPLSKGSKLLELVYSWRMLRIGRLLYGKGPEDFLKQKERILSIPLPKETGILYGTKNFEPRKILSWIIPLFMSVKNSDGKVLVEEVMDKNVDRYINLHLYHSYLMNHRDARLRIKWFFLKGSFFG